MTGGSPEGREASLGLSLGPPAAFLHAAAGRLLRPIASRHHHGRVLIKLGTSEARGRGVYAAIDIAEGELIEECPVVVIAPDEVGHLQKTALRDYFFVWGGVGDAAAIALGYGSLYNHAREPNAMYVRKHEAHSIAFFAVRAIHAGEEITVSYHGGFGDRGDVWFDVR